MYRQVFSYCVLNSYGVARNLLYNTQRGLNSPPEKIGNVFREKDKEPEEETKKRAVKSVVHPIPPERDPPPNVS